jgi:hypothetical protein
MDRERRRISRLEGHLCSGSDNLSRAFSFFFLLLHVVCSYFSCFGMSLACLRLVFSLILDLICPCLLLFSSSISFFHFLVSVLSCRGRRVSQKWHVSVYTSQPNSPRGNAEGQLSLALSLSLYLLVSKVKHPECKRRGGGGGAADT